MISYISVCERGYLRELLFPNRYHYYDTPEGQDCDKKLWNVLENCALYGLMGSTVDVIMYSHPKGYLPTLGRYAYITLPFMGMGASFVITTCMATNLRKKDDVWNYFLGGATVGAIFGAWRKSIKFGGYGSLAFGALFAIRKYCLENGIYNFTEPEYPKYTNDPRVWSLKRDYSIINDPGRTWKTSHNE